MTTTREWSGRAERITRLWTLRGVSPALVHAVVYTHPLGLELRVLRGDDFLRTQVVRDMGAAVTLADEWKRRLEERGWRLEPDLVPGKKPS